MIQGKNLLLLVLFLLLNFMVRATNKNHEFRHLTINEGLSNSNVNCIVQDSNGFIWIGTENGLNKYDGYKFTHYYSDVNKKNSLASNEIHTLMVDSKGVLWVGTFQGLFKYNETNDNFDKITFNHVDNLSTNIPVYALLEDADDIIWIGTSGRGLFKYKKGKGIIKSYNNIENEPYSLSSNFVFSLLKKGNTIWIGTTNNGLDKFDLLTEKFFNYKPIENVRNKQNVNAILTMFEFDSTHFLLGSRGDGLFKFNTETKIFTQFSLQNTKGFNYSPKEIYNIYKDSKQRLWIASHGDGLFCIENNIVERFEHDSELNSSLINNNLRTIFEDRQGNLWFVSYQGGVNILPSTIKKFTTYSFNEKNEYSSNIITSAIIDDANNLWVGTDGGGLKYVNRKTGGITNYHPGNNNAFVDDKVVMSMMLDENKLWIGTYLKGLAVLDLNTQKVEHYVNTESENSLSENFVSCFLKSSKGEIWIGTIGGGVNRFNPEKGTFEHFRVDEEFSESSLVNDYVNTIAEDNNGRLWIGTFWGLSVFDPYNNMYVRYLQSDEGGGSLSNNVIYSIKISSKNQIWIGTRNGLNKFEPASNSFKSFNLANGLPGNVIYSIEEDKSGNLWLSTNNGICNFNTSTFETSNYFKSDGLPTNEFFRNASVFNKSGELIFGSLNGLVSFYPDSIVENYEVPKVAITKFAIFNEEVLPGHEINNEVLLTDPTYKTNKIVLKHKYNNFGFEFSALDFIMPDKLNYKCKMEGFDTDWRLMSYEQRYVTYTNLDAGTYVFKVKASSIDNEWGTETTDLTIVIKPPIYRTWWAYLIYYLLVMVVVWFLWSVSIKRVKLKNQIAFERLERDKANEINQAKLQFFTNISHEFRTPITLIMGPLEKMIGDKTVIKKYGNSINLMLKNADRLLRLVNQLMDLRKVEMGKMKLKTEKADIIYFIKEIYNSFTYLAQQKSIVFKFESDFENFDCYFDADKLDKIFFNLLSNAFKFTNAQGTITLSISGAENSKGISCLRISVSDTGCGISEKDQAFVFDRFFQTTDKGQRFNAGSGVGLSLTKSLVEQHYGEIVVKSELNVGTEFYMLLPTDENIYDSTEKFDANASELSLYVHKPVDEIEESTFETNLDGEKSLTVLVVEDNYDLRKYIISELAPSYNILEAANGKEGLDIALQESPDLVISDIVMPEMDGLELCRSVKENFITNHIPVILLTARASIEHRIKGIDQGADSYIPKPFNPTHLKIRVKKLLELRMVLRNKYSTELKSADVNNEPEEDQYLKDLKELILKNIDDPDLNIDKICKEMSISRAHMYRKIKLITDKSPTEFVRIIRLNEAAKMFLNSKKSVSEVCYMVGFNSPSYFSICFKEHFKCTPVEFVKKNN